MFLFFKSFSRSVHEEQQELEPEQKLKAGDHHGGGNCISLTVWRKSLLINCYGFTVIGSDGNLVYRVDDYIGPHPEELTLMDASGRSLLTMRRRKKLTSLVDSWFIYEGEEGIDDGDDRELSQRRRRPICCVKKHVNILRGNTNHVLAQVCYGRRSKRVAYTVEGSYMDRSCKVLDVSSRMVVAEIKRKQTTQNGASFGADVFVLVVHPGFVPRFAMALVLLLDQMFS